MKRLKWIVVLLLLAGYSQAQNPLNTITVASYNLRMDTKNDSLNAWEYRKDKVISLVKYHQFDIIGTQEGFTHQLNDLKKGGNYQFEGVGRDDGKQEGEYAAIFYNDKFKKLDGGTFWLSEMPNTVSFGWDAVCRRVCTWVKLEEKTSKKRFFVFNIHFDHKGKQAKENSAKLLLTKVNEICGNQPVIITGDFNSTPESLPITLMTQKYPSSKTIASFVYGPKETINDRFEICKPLKNAEIDYIFTNLKALRYAVLTDSFNGFYPSDHLPVVADIVIR